MTDEAEHLADHVDAGARFTPDGVLGALWTMAERHRQPGESLEAAFARVTRHTDAGARLYAAFRQAENARSTLTGR